MLQRGRAHVSAESCPEEWFIVALDYLLQRGRAHVSAESSALSRSDPCNCRASTGPRSRERGKRITCRRSTLPENASKGPRSRERGKERHATFPTLTSI